jgi:hypothetical protein
MATEREREYSIRDSGWYLTGADGRDYDPKRFKYGGVFLQIPISQVREWVSS